MATNEEMEKRLNIVEEKARVATRTAETTRHVAEYAQIQTSSFGDKLDAHRDLLMALRDTQVEQGNDIKELRKENKDSRTEVREGFGKLAIGAAEITALLTRSLEEK
jgi:hypothetical protein